MKAMEKQGKRGWTYAPSGAKVQGTVTCVEKINGKFYADFLIDGQIYPFSVRAKNVRVKG